MEFLGLRTAVYSVADMETAKAWYASVLGIAPYFDQPFYVGFNVGGYELGLMPTETADADREFETSLIYWGVTSADDALNHLIGLGATVRDAVTDVGDGIRLGTVTTATGNIFGVIENPHFTLA